ncbi:insulin gene enhancer protein ISL-2-like isoform X1 [Esox lucius]|uniref:insulin gene enhancer protein ISL-2-like isoform X1 n=1 Tax=Esox lucius TaxID=8010 RepID=UPI00097347B0|nr:insulin gene enhancer protein ISL-2-like isoform X1 [Esox lucius]
MLEEDTVQDHSSAGRSASRCNGDLCPPGAVWPCTGCGEPIRDPEVLRVGTDQQWHIGCLYCDECHCPLGESVSCFLRNGRTLCRTDYGRLFAEKCKVCGEALLSSDLVVRAGGQIYHPACLHCSICGALLRPGDSFTLGPQGPRCQAEHTTPEQQNREGDTLKQIKGRRGGVWERCEDRLKSRRVRMRTVLSDSQLRALRSCYSQSPRPDALAKLQLSRLTGLNQRVIRVWFQNKRCKDKKSHARRGARPAGGFTVSQALLSARPMVVLSPETPDFALQIYIFKSPWQSHDGHATDRKDHFLTETSQSTCSSEDLHSSQHHSV